MFNYTQHNTLAIVPLTENGFEPKDGGLPISPLGDPRLGQHAELEEAVSRGWAIVPITADKQPPRGFLWKPFQSERATLEQVAKWNTSYQPAAWAVVTGEISGVVVLDFDGDEGRETMERLGLSPHVRTGSGGYHVYAKHPGWHVPTLNGKAKKILSERWPGLDVKGDGGYAIFTGSTEKGSYQWLRDPEPDEPEVVPTELWEFLRAKPSPIALEGHAKSNGSYDRVSDRTLLQRALDQAADGEGRNNAGFGLAIQLRDNNYESDEAELVMREYVRQVPPTNAKGEYEEYTEAEALSSLNQAYSREPREPWTIETEASAEMADIAVPKAVNNAEDGQHSGMTTLAADDHLRGEIDIVHLSDVEPEQVKWLWRDRVPLGKLTIIDGDPGLGKSTLTLDLAARVSRGMPMPDGTIGDLEGAAGVVLLALEDGLADTIRPRLDAAGADTTRIVALRGRERLPTLDDLGEIRRGVEKVGAKLVVVDPLMAHLSARVDTRKDDQIRRALAPLVTLAEEMGFAVVAVRHLNKGDGQKALYRGGGSIGFIATARSGLLVAEDPDDSTKQRRILAANKSNLAAKAPSLSYRTVEAPNGAVRIDWEGPTYHTADGLLAAQATADGEPRRIDEATDFLRETLADGPLPSTIVEARASLAGIATKTLQRAKTLLGVQPNKVGFGKDGEWYCSLPDDAKMANLPKDGQTNGTTALGDVGHLRDIASNPAGSPASEAAWASLESHGRAMDSFQ